MLQRPKNSETQDKNNRSKSDNRYNNALRDQQNLGISSIGAAGFSQLNNAAAQENNSGLNILNAAAFIQYDRTANRNATLLAQNADISENADEEESK